MALLQMPERMQVPDPLLTADEVAVKLNVTRDWVWDHSSRRLPYLPVIRMSDGALRYSTSQIDEFVNERGARPFCASSDGRLMVACLFPTQNLRSRWELPTRKDGSRFEARSGTATFAARSSIPRPINQEQSRHRLHSG